jgi:GTPase SAR1 family protein
MGICGSTVSPQDRAEQNKSKILEATMKQKKTGWEGIHKLLLLGAGESGKSTLFKQMIKIYGTEEDKNLSVEDRKPYVELIHGNIAQNSLTLAEACHTHGEPTTPEGQEALAFIEAEMAEDTVITSSVAVHLKAFWADPGIQTTYDNRSSFQLNDSAAYFYQRLDQVSSTDWLPDFDDIMRTRVRTTGIVEHSFVIDSNPFRMFDVGGQRNERKKWIHCFENVTAVIFVVAISEFDQVLFEDDCTNRMTEALTLFENICGSEWFIKTAMILFLNKEDLFREKIATKNIQDSLCPQLQEFDGNPRDFKETSEFIQEVFIETGAHNEKEIHAHVTCATNTANVNMVFEDVKEIIITLSLEEAGLT